MHSKYAWIYHGEHVSKAYMHTITFQHELEPRYNVVLVNYFDQAIRNIVGVAPTVESGHSSCTVSFEETRP